MLINSLSTLLFAVNERQDERRGIPERRVRDKTRHELTAASAFSARNLWKGYNGRDKIFCYRYIPALEYGNFVTNVCCISPVSACLCLLVHRNLPECCLCPIPPFVSVPQEGDLFKRGVVASWACDSAVG
jgi:hypothetical protein